MIERFRSLELAGSRAAFFGLHEHAPAGREEHRDLARLGDLDDALAEARMLDALADFVLETRGVIAHGLRQIGGDRRLLEALDRRFRCALGTRRERIGLALLFGRAVRRLVAVVAAALLALHLDDLLADLRDDYVPHVSALRTESFDICANSRGHARFIAHDSRATSGA